MNHPSTLDKSALLERFKIEKVTQLLECPLIKNGSKLIPYSFAKKKLVLPLELSAGVLKLAMVDPFDFEALEEVRSITGHKIKEVYATSQEIESAIEKCYHQTDEEASQYIEDLQQQTKSNAKVKRKSTIFSIRKQTLLSFVC